MSRPEFFKGKGLLTDICNDASGIRHERPKFLAMVVCNVGTEAPLYGTVRTCIYVAT